MLLLLMTQKISALIEALGQSVDNLTAADAANLATIRGEISAYVIQFTETLETASSTINQSLVAIQSSFSAQIATLSSSSQSALSSHVAAFNAAVSRLEGAIASGDQATANAAASALAAEVVKLDKAIVDIAANSADIAQLRIDLTDAVAKLETADSTNVATIRGEIAGHIVSLSAQASQVLADSVSEINEALTALTTNFTTQISNLSTANQTALTAQSTALSNAITALNTAISTGDTASANAAAAALKTAVDALNDKIAELEGEIDANTAAIQSATASITAIQTQVNGIDFIDQTELNAALASLTTQLQNYADANDSDTSFDATGLQAQIDSLKTRVTNVEGFAATLTSLQNQINGIDFVDENELTTALGLLRTELQMYADSNDDNTQIDPSSLQDAIDDLVRRVTSLEEDLEKLESDFMSLESTVDGAITSITRDGVNLVLTTTSGATSTVSLAAFNEDVNSIVYNAETGILTLYFTTGTGGTSYPVNVDLSALKDAADAAGPAGPQGPAGDPADIFVWGPWMDPADKGTPAAEADTKVYSLIVYVDDAAVSFPEGGATLALSMAQADQLVADAKSANASSTHKVEVYETVTSGSIPAYSYEQTRVTVLEVRGEVDSPAPANPNYTETQVVEVAAVPGTPGGNTLVYTAD